MSIELLAPAGNPEKLKTAIQYGADAVYLAGRNFGLRTAAGNFTKSGISEGVAYAHLYAGKVYVAINALLHQSEIDRLPEYVKFLEDAEVDGVICSDMGVVNVVRKNTNIPVHISTQASVLNSRHAQIWKDCGAKRIVVGRELSIDEAAELKSIAGMEIEMFVHGAMCMAYSGQCFLSNYTVNRDANRGGCIQNCRFKYEIGDQSGAVVNGSHLLSSKDLCGIRLLERFRDAGIDALKIEGRMRSALYAASTARAYAQGIRAVEQGRGNDLIFWESELRKIPNRGYTQGFLVEPAGPDSVVDQESAALNQYKMAGQILEIDAANKRFAFEVKNRLNRGDRIEILSFSGKNIEIEIEDIVNLVGDPLTAAQPSNVIRLPLKPGIEANNVARIFRPD